MKSLASKTWKIVLALFLTLVAVLGVFGMPSSKPNDVWAAAGDTYTLVENASALAAGDKVIIVAADSELALSITQNENNRTQTAITKADNGITPDNNVQILTLEKGTQEGTFAFNTGSGYLYAASSSSNHLKTQTTMNDNGSWKIEITSNGVATIKAQGTNTRNWLRYNSSSKIFSCYASGQADIALYEFQASTCEHTYNEETTKAATCTEAGTKTLTCSKCSHTYTQEIPATHTYIDNVCSVCKTKLLTYQKVTNISNLSIGDSLIIAVPSKNIAMGAQTDTYRSSAAITTVNTIATFAENEGVILLTLEEGTTKGTYALKATDGYLCWTDGNSVSISENTYDWTITIENGVTTISSTTDSNRKIKYNSSSPRFACYTSAQTDITLYKLQTSKILTSVTLTSDLSINFYAEDLDGVTVQANDSVLTASTTTTTSEGKTYRQYTYAHIEPQQIADTVTVNVYDSENKVIAFLDYSVKAYCDQIINQSEDAELVTLCKALLHYGAEAQKVANYNTDSLVNEGIDDLDGVTMNTNDYAVKTLESATVEITGVSLSLENSITLKYTLKVTGELSGNLIAKIYLDGSSVTNGIDVQDNGDTYTVSYTFASAQDFSKKVILMVGDSDGQKSDLVQYSVKTYCTAMAEDETYGALVKAIYNYVTCIDAYVAANPEA